MVVKVFGSGLIKVSYTLLISGYTPVHGVLVPQLQVIHSHHPFASGNVLINGLGFLQKLDIFIVLYL